MVLPIYIYGQPVLRKEAEDIPTDYPELDTFLKDMWETLAESEGIGLAAPQVGKAIRVVVIDLDVLSEDMPEYKDFRHAYINPHIVEYDDTETNASEEGCLSLDGVRKTVRYQNIEVEYLDSGWKKQRQKYSGWTAQIIQHEVDHLNGIII